MQQLPMRSGEVCRNVHPISLFIGLVVMAVAFGIQVPAMFPPPAKPETVPSSEFSAARALALAARLMEGIASHPIGTDDNEQMRARIIAELEALDYVVETQGRWACQTGWGSCGYVHNIYTRLPGRTEGPAVLLVAHYDTVGASPGAADDMAGVVVILEIASMLRAEAPLAAPVIFLFTDGEEMGLFGAQAFVDGHPWAADVGVVINLEARGTGGPSTLFETTDNNAWLIEAFVTHAPRPITNSLIDEIYKYLPNNTDLTVFEAAGLAGVNFAFTEEVAHYHTPLDNLVSLNPGSVQHHGDNALAAVRAFANLNLAQPPAGNSVFLDLSPRLIVRWPESWTLWIALACLVVWLALAIALMWRGLLPVRSLLWGAAVLPLGLLAAALVGLGIVFALNALTGSPVSWHAHPLPLRAALWVGAILIMALVGAAFARRAGFWGLTLAIWLWWCLLSLLVAWLLPGVSIIFICSTLLALAALAAVVFTPLHRAAWGGEIAVMVALFGTSYLWLTFAYYMEMGAGVEIGALAGLSVALAASALVPLLAVGNDARQIRRWTLVGCVLILVVAFGLAAWVPTYSESRPQRLNLLHVDQRHLQQANWLVESGTLTGEIDREIPQELRQAAAFGSDPLIALPGSSRHYFAAPATATNMPAPDVYQSADERVNGVRRLQLQLRSPRGGEQVTLLVPEKAGVRRIEVLGTDYVMDTFPSDNGYQRFACFAQACNGLELALYLESDAAFPLLIMDTTRGLPPGGGRLLQARPATAVPSHGGDATIIVNEIMIEELTAP